MSTYTQIIYHIVFGTKHRQRTLTEDNREELYRYIGGILMNKKCHVHQIGGIEDHIHILTHVHPNVSVSELVKDIKMASTSYIKTNNLFKNFKGWQNGYGAFTYSVRERHMISNYIKNQKAHHLKTDFKDEFIKMLTDHEIVFDEKYLADYSTPSGL
jgi:REP element-mobilizing transposase RayT